MKKLKETKISGISLPLYAFFVAVIIVVTLLGKLPLDMVGLTLLLVTLGHLLYFIGEKLPIMNSYLGGGSVFTLIGATLLSFFHIVLQMLLEQFPILWVENLDFLIFI